MTEDIYALIQQFCKQASPLSISDHLRDDLGLDSVKLIELTIKVHSQFGIDLGRRAAERKMRPETVGDIIALVKNES